MSRVLSFIGLQLPVIESNEVRKFQRYMKDNYGVDKALQSPVHITLQPPFKIEKEDSQSLQACLSMVRQHWQPFSIQVNGFGVFSPHVIFAEVTKSPELEHLRDEINAQLKENAFIAAQNDEKDFHPHITIASKGLNPKTFAKAWEYFRDIPFTCSWKVEEFVRYQHDGNNWKIAESYEFTP